jgi:hypothetical protein
MFMSVLNLKENGNIVEAVIDAIVAGYRDDLILEELAQAIEDEKVTKDQFESAVGALELYAVRFTDSIQNVSNAMKQFEFNDKKTILKNRPLNLAQQVMQDVEGFSNASKEFYGDEEEENKEADIKKPQPKELAQKPEDVPKKQPPVAPPMKKEKEEKPKPKEEDENKIPIKTK